VVEVVQDAERVGDDRVAALALGVRDDANATGVVLVGGVVEPLRSRVGREQHVSGLLVVASRMG